MTPNKKTAAGFDTRAASKLHSSLHFISPFAWRRAYSLEEAPQSHGHFRRLACCIGLAALRLLTGGLHHV